MYINDLKNPNIKKVLNVDAKIYWKYVLLTSDEILFYDIEDYMEDMDNNHNYFLMKHLLYFPNKKYSPKKSVYQIRKIDNSHLTKKEANYVIRSLLNIFADSIRNMDTLMFNKTLWRYNTIYNKINCNKINYNKKNNNTVYNKKINNSNKQLNKISFKFNSLLN